MDGEKRIVRVVVLAIATLSGSWCAYQGARWSGHQVEASMRADSLRAESVRASNRAFQSMQVDVTTFALWLGANLQHQPTTAQAYRDRFRAEFVPAFDRWLAGAEPPGTLPLGTPFQLPQYRPEYMTKAEELNRQADAAVAEGRAANQHSDNFMFSVVMFSSVIFLAGLDQDPASPHFVLRWAVAALASIMLVVSLVFMLRLPVDLG